MLLDDMNVFNKETKETITDQPKALNHFGLNKPRDSSVRSSNSKIGNALANLIKAYGKKSNKQESDATSSLTGSSITNKSRHMKLFESAFK